MAEKALSFACHGDWLYGVLSLPEQALTRGVLIVAGGPQYRAGSHRQFTLLARHLAAHGIPVMRFDYRGMGDSEGAPRSFEEIGKDLRAAIDCFMLAAPGLKEVVIWGLCDAASAALFYAHQDQRVAGLALVNPWVRTDQGMAKAYLKHYYLRRAFDAGLWKKIAYGRFDYAAAGRSFAALARQVFHPQAQADRAPHPAAANGHEGLALPDRMYQGLTHFHGKILLVLSGNDLTAQEFSELVSSSKKWQKLLGERTLQRHELAGANHTFSQRVWRDQVACWTTNWLRSW